SAVEEVDHPSAINGVPSQAVGCPGNEALSFAALDSVERLVKDRSARRHRALRFGERVNDLDAVLRSEEPLQFAVLGVDGLDLAVFLFGGLAAVDEVLHVGLGVGFRHSTGAAAGASSVARSLDFASRAAVSEGVGVSRMR